jgi:hypothetical protein
MFCDRSFIGISTTRAVYYILGRPVMAQDKAGMKCCIAIKTKEEDRPGGATSAWAAFYVTLI